MYAGAAVSAVELIIGLALIIVGVKDGARGRFWGVNVTAPQMKPILITVWIVVGLVGIALWLWMARANGQGRNWARILSTVLFVLATLQLISDFQRAVSPAGTIEPVRLDWQLGNKSLRKKKKKKKFFRLDGPCQTHRPLKVADKKQRRQDEKHTSRGGAPSSGPGGSARAIHSHRAIPTRPTTVHTRDGDRFRVRDT